MMAGGKLQEIGIENEVVLVLLVRVVGDVANASCEGEFGYNVYVFFDLELRRNFSIT